MLPLIPFNKPYFSGNETRYIEQAVRSGKISGDGLFTQQVHRLFGAQLGFRKVLLTTSCTDTLEMAALLLNIGPGDEVIIPSFTFVSTANDFVLRGATVVFADSTALNSILNLNAAAFESLATSHIRVIVPVYYAGIACDMDAIQAVAARHQLAVVEDAAHTIDSYYRGRALGILEAFSFHETKNIISGERGMMAINDERLAARAELIQEKSTTRTAFYRGEVDKYVWVDLDSSFLPSDIIVAYLWAQLENLVDNQQQRRAIWVRYYAALAPLQLLGIGLPVLPDFAINNRHLFNIAYRSLTERTALLAHLKQRGTGRFSTPAVAPKCLLRDPARRPCRSLCRPLCRLPRPSTPVLRTFRNRPVPHYRRGAGRLQTY